MAAAPPPLLERTSLSSTDPGTSELMRVQWPYKYLWNVLRGESIVADDDVVLEELRNSYDRFILALTQYPFKEAPPVVEPSQEPTTTGPQGPPPGGTTDDEQTLLENEKKLKRRVAAHLELPDDTAWDVFLNYMMFEYRGGSTSCEKLLESPRVSTDFLTDLKTYYDQERISVLLVIQAVFGFSSHAGHKYNRLFTTVLDWVREKDDTQKLTHNLIQSLETAKTPEEEVEVLHALTLFIYHVPEAVGHFCGEFVAFKPGHKPICLLQAESTVLYTLLNFPLLQEAEEDVPLHLQSSVEKFLEHAADDLLINEYNLGAVLSGFFSAAGKNRKIKESLSHPKHEFVVTFSRMLEIANDYAKEWVVGASSSNGGRNNLSTVVLKSLMFALRALVEGFKGDKIFRCGGEPDLYELAAVLMGHSSVAALLCSDDVLQITISTANRDFPLKLKYMTRIWGSLCTASAGIPHQFLQLLKDCCKMVYTLAEITTDLDSIRDTLELHAPSGLYRLLENRTVAGVDLPPGTELDHLDDDDDGLTTLYWRVPHNMVIDVFAVVNRQVLTPLATAFQKGSIGSTVPIDSLVKWVNEDNVWSLTKFLIQYASCAPAITESLSEQYEPVAFILFKTLDYTPNYRTKTLLCSHLIDLLVAANKFGAQSWSDVYFSELWPARLESSSFISDIIMGHESVATTDCAVTNAFLTSVASFFKGSGLLRFETPLHEEIAYKSVDFLNENVFHSFTRWRFSSIEAKFRVLLNCLKVYNLVFNVNNQMWDGMKNDCARVLLAESSSLMTVLSAPTDSIQSSVLLPTASTHLIPEIIHQSLAVLLKLFHFQQDAIRLVDVSLGSTLVQKLGRFARHRLDYKIPTLAMSLLRKICEEMNMSLLSCFGSEEVSFRDLISQRLEFKSEDVNLKIAILDFLTVAAHTQPGLIQYVFMDDFLAQKIVDLPTEKDEGLSLAVLCFLRALFRKGATIMKTKCQNLWENVFFSIKQPITRQKIITCTLNIASLELFRYGPANTKFSAEIRALLKQDNFLELFKLPILTPTDQSTKCLLSFKHFISVVLHRNDVEDALEVTTRKALLDIVTQQCLIRSNETPTADSLKNPHRSKALVDLTCQLLSSIDDEPFVGAYFAEIAGRIGNSFFESSVHVQVGLLVLTNACVKKSPTPSLTSSVLEPLLRIASQIFDNAGKIFNQKEDIDVIGPLISLSSALIVAVIGKVPSSEWDSQFHRYMIPNAIVHATWEGVTNSGKESILMELLYVLLKMAEVPECAESLVSGLIVPKVLLTVLRNAERTFEGEEAARHIKTHLVTLQIMTQLLRTERIYFLDHSLSLWGSHGTHIITQLHSLPGMTSKCKLNQPEYNFQMMKALLTFDVYALDSISSLVPFWKHWTLNTNYAHLRVLEATFIAMQTSVNLLDQPQYLQSFISLPHMLHQQQGRGQLELRPTPQLLELHSKLWDVIHLSTSTFWSLRTWTSSASEGGKILATSNQISQACIKALSKPESKRSRHSSSGPATPSSHHHHVLPTTTATSARILDTLERTVSLYLFHGKRILENPEATEKQIQNISRELAVDAGTLCDGIRRVTAVSSHSLLSSDVLVKLCHALEVAFNLSNNFFYPDEPAPTCHHPSPPHDVTEDHQRTMLMSVSSPAPTTPLLLHHPVFGIGMDTPKSRHGALREDCFY